MKLFLIRHGNTDWADTRKHTGRTDVPLNARGQQAAHSLRERLSRYTFARVFTSPLTRAKQTCGLAGFSDRAEVVSDLAEWDYGQYEGMLTADILRANPKWNLFRDGAPGGESVAQVAARANRFVAQARAIPGDLIAFSHGHMIRMIAAAWLSLPPQCAAPFYTSTASISILGNEHENEPVILLWNET